MNVIAGSAKEKEAKRLGKVKNPKVIGLMYSYRAGIARNLSSNLVVLALEKAPPKQKTLEEILGGSEEEKPEGQE